MLANEELREDISHKLDALSGIAREVDARERQREAITSLVLLFIILLCWFISSTTFTAFVAGAATINALRYVRRWLGLDD